MPKKSQQSHDQRDGLPSREDVLAFIAREKAETEASGGTPHKIGKREIARAFNITGAKRIGLKQMLRELQDEGLIEKRGKKLHKTGQLPNVVLADISGRDIDGELIAVPAEVDDLFDGEPPKISIMTRKLRRGEQAPGVGDRVLVRCEPETDAKPGQPAYRGRVIKLLNKPRTRVLGIFRAGDGGGGRIEPVEKKQVGRELAVAPGAEGDARDGDLVSVDVMKEGRYGLPRAKVTERLGRIDSEKAISLIAINAHDIPNQFSPSTLEAAENAAPATMKGREDWRELPLITIDPADAKDHDDAVFAQADDDPDNKGGFILTVAIADVAAYVTPGSPLDREALERGNSVYFPDRVVPMLPERISNNLCSLRADEDRPAMAVRMIVNSEGRKLRHTFHRVMMRSSAKLAYQQAQAAIDGAPDDTTGPLLDTVLRPLWTAYGVLKKAREHRHPLDLDLPERKLILAEDGTIDRVIIPPRLDAHRLIEEFMILANVAAAETLEQKSQHLIYRAHDEPSPEKLNAFAEFLSTIGIKLAKGQVLRPQQFNRILAQVKDSEHEHVVNEVVLRTQAQAEYVAENYGHFGLNLKRYAHFTSPIRRYADLIVHRALIRALGLGKDGLPDMDMSEMAEIAARISAAERRAMAAERETTERLIAHFLGDQVGATFHGRISGVIRSGLFVKLADTGADGFVPAGSLGRDYYHYDESIHALVSNRSGEMFRLGDQVEVRLVEAAPLAGALRFEVLSEGTPVHERELHGVQARRGGGNGPAYPGGRGRKSGNRPGKGPGKKAGKRAKGGPKGSGNRSGAGKRDTKPSSRQR